MTNPLAEIARLDAALAAAHALIRLRDDQIIYLQGKVRTERLEDAVVDSLRRQVAELRAIAERMP